MKNIMRACAAATLFAAGIASGAMTTDLEETPDPSYQLENHPDSQLARTGSPDYGLRLNGYFLEPVVTKYTFDFEHESSGLELSKSGNQYTIEGQVFGGSSTEYNPDYLPLLDGVTSSATLWDLSWTMFDTGSSCPAGYVTCLTGGTGMLSSDLGSFRLTGISNESGVEFGFIDNFRGFAGTTGWGWVMWENRETGLTGKGDFMFIKGLEPPSEVPLPASIVFMLSALSGLILVKRRRN